MAFDVGLAARVRDVLQGESEISEQKMFGGLCFLLHGNLLVGVWKDSLIARLGADAAQTARTEPYVREFDVTGRPMRNWVLIEAEGLRDQVELDQWVRSAWDFVSKLPQKQSDRGQKKRVDRSREND